MKAHQIRKFDMMRRVQGFLDDRATEPSVLNGTAARREFDALVREIGVNEAAQAVSTLSARGHTATLAVLRQNLWRHHMRPIATIAAAHLRDVPEFSPLRMPTKDVKVAVLIQAAMAMSEAARPHRQVFVDNGRRPDFADELLAAAAAVRASIDTRAASIAEKASAREGLKSSASRAWVLLQFFDAQVKSELADDPAALAGWSSARRIGTGKVKVTPAEDALPFTLSIASQAA